MAIDFKGELNERQCQACTSGARHLRIIAGAGTGKTRVLTYRIAYMVSSLGIIPNRLVAITFTRKAANELKDRTGKLLENAGITGYRPAWISTIHSFCNLILRREASHIPGYTDHFTIADDDDQKTIIRSVVEKLGKKGDKDAMKYLLSRIGGFKSKGLFPEEVPDGKGSVYGEILTPSQVKEGYTLYQDLLRKNGSLDFDDLLLFTYRLLEESPEIRSKWANRFDAFLMDEFQDTDPLQYELVKLLLRTDTYFSVVGDPDQTIYTWRGAESKLITDRLSQDFPDLETVTLEVNYRSTQNILDRANKLIKNNNSKLEKSLVAASGDKGDDVVCSFYSSREQEAFSVVNRIIDLRSQGFKYGDIAIIYRSNYLSSEFEKCLSNNRIPYDIYGGLKFYERAEIKDALSYLRLIVNPSDSISFHRILDAPKIGIGDVGRRNISKAAERDGMPEFQEAIQNPENLGLMQNSVARLKKLREAYEKCLEALKDAKSGSDYNTALFAYLDGAGFIEHVSKLDKADDEKSLDTNNQNTRLNNVKELLKQIVNYMDSEHYDEDGNLIQPDLDAFLIDVAIQSDADRITGADRVLLMTGHISKGLEFPVVFVVGMNDGVFPTNHAITEGSRRAIEEERRLFYVAITRAMKKLFISSPGGHGFDGLPQLPSMFLSEIGFNRPKGDSFYFSTGGGYPNSRFGSGYSRGSRVTYSHVSPSSSQSSASISSQQAGANRLLNTPPKSLEKAKSVTTYAVGERIAHSSFGVGTITKVGATSITVKFDEPYGEKTLSKSFTRAFRKI